MSYSDREVWLPAIVITSAPDGRPTAETGALSAFAFVDIVLHIDPPVSPTLNPVPPLHFPLDFPSCPCHVSHDVLVRSFPFLSTPPRVCPLHFPYMSLLSVPVISLHLPVLQDRSPKTTFSAVWGEPPPKKWRKGGARGVAC